MRQSPTTRIIALNPHRGFMHRGTQSLDRKHITLRIPGWTVLLSHNDVEYVSYRASICYKHVQITYKPRERLANNMNERKVEMDHPSLPVAPAQPSPCSMKHCRTFRSLDHNAPYTAFPSITVASTFVFRTWSAGTSIMSCENTT